MKIGLYICDFLYKIGGTESYTARLSESLLSIFPTSEISIVTELYSKKDLPSNKDFINRINESYGTNILEENLNLDYILGSKRNFFSTRIFYKKIQESSKKYDLFFYCSMGNFVFKAKRNIAIIHFPTHTIVEQKKFENKFDLPFFTQKKDKKYAMNYDLFLPNSDFTNKWLKTFRPDISVSKIITLYPPIKLSKIENKNKCNAILTCSRIEKSKKIEHLIEAYSNSKFLKQNYELWICGNKDKNDDGYYQKLIDKTKELNVKFFISISNDKLQELFSTARFFWHAKGFGIEENLNPYAMEHFGMSTVEAMSAGCIPIVINKGGQPEIVTEKTGFTWNTLEELTSKTENTAKLSSEELLEFSENARKRSEFFDIAFFNKRVKNILTANSEQRTANSEQRTANSEQRTANSEQ